MSCLVSVGIKGIVLSLGLAGSVCAAGFPAQEPPPGSLSATLLPSNTPQEVAGILVSAPPANPSDRATNPATLQGQEPSDRTDRVSSNAQEIPPSIVPLPLLGAQPPQVPRRDQRPPNTPNPPARGAPPNQSAQPRPAQPRAANDNLQQLQFDRDGLVTMHTNELDVRQLLELLSRRSRLNILVSPKVSGTVTANFEGVTLDRVLAAVLKLAHLVEKKEGSIHYIYTKQEIVDEAEDVKKERILTKVYKLNYVRSDEMLNMIRPFLSVDVGQKRVATSPSYRFGISESNTFASGGAMSASGSGGSGSGGGGTGGGGMGGGGSMGGGGMTGGAGGGMGGAGSQPTSGGNSLADSDHLVIQDYESNLKIIDQIISRIDIRPVQVLIEAVIISVDLEHDRELGVNFAVVDNLAQMLGTVGSGTALNGNVGFNPTQLLTAAGKIAQGATADPQGFTSATNGVKFGFVADNVTGFVRALETLGSTKVLASPRILVLNKQRAEIQLGARLGFQTLSQNFTSTIQQVQFLNTGTLLRLRPFVSDDGMVRMEIHPERSTGVVSNNLPSAQTAELTTNVMVPDGATLVIGGLMDDEDDYQVQGLPGLSRIPALGYLFGARQKTEGRRELVVLLTPHIWSPDHAMSHTPCVAKRTQGAVTTGVPSSPLSELSQARASDVSVSSSRPQVVTGVEPAPAGQERQGSTPSRRRPRLSLGQLLPWRSTAQKQEQSPSEPRSKAVPSAPAPVAPLAARAVQSDAMVTQARWGPGAKMSPAQGEGIRRSRADSGPATQTRSTGSRPGVMDAGPRWHTVRQGETFATIAQIYYGSGHYEQALWWANHSQVAGPGSLAVGDRIVVPAVEALDHSLIRPVR